MIPRTPNTHFGLPAKIQLLVLSNIRRLNSTNRKSSSIMQPFSWPSPASLSPACSWSARPLYLQPFVRLCAFSASARTDARHQCAMEGSTAQLARQISRPVSTGAAATEQAAVAEQALSLSALSSRTEQAEAKVAQAVQVCCYAVSL